MVKFGVQVGSLVKCCKFKAMKYPKEFGIKSSSGLTVTDGWWRFNSAEEYHSSLILISKIFRKEKQFWNKKN